MHIGTFSPRSWSMRLALLVVLGVASPGWAQPEQLGTEKGTTDANSKALKRRNELFSGEGKSNKVTEADDKQVAKAAAEYAIYRITWRKAIERSKNPLTYEKMQADFEADVKKITEKSDRAFVKLYSEALIGAMNDVLLRDIKEDPATVINVCMMMPTMAKVKHPEIGDYLASLVKDDKNDAAKTHPVVRLYALKALKECFPVRPQPSEVADDTNVARGGLPEKRDKKLLDIRCVDALVNFIGKKVDVSGKTKEEIAEKTGLVQYFRREAIASLANAAAPAVWYTKKAVVEGKGDAKFEGQVAPTLLRVLAKNGGMNPPPLLQEKIDAAVGLCAMRYPDMPEYEPDLAIYLVGQTIVEFANEFKADWGEFSGKSKLPKIAWKSEAKRLEEALKKLSDNAPAGSATQKKAEQLKQAATPILVNISNYRQPTLILELNSKVVQTHRPKSGAVWKTFKAPPIPLD